MANHINKTNIEILSYNDLKTKTDLSVSIENAFGGDGLGIILVKDIPNFELLRGTLLKLSKKLSSLSIKTKEKYKYSYNDYLSGWYQKKITMKNKDLFVDTFCANPLYDNIMVSDDYEKKYSKIFSSNIWPQKEIPELKIAFKNLGITMLQVSFWILIQCDKYLHKITDGVHKENTIYHIISNSQIYKGKLIHSNSVVNKKNKKNNGDNLHINYESLICHVSPMFLSKKDDIINNTDNYHMYIKSKKGEKIKIKIPNNCLALQIGETLQILSGGYLKAKPHYLRLCQKPQISMEQFSVYVDCFPEQPLEFPQYTKADNIGEGLKSRIKDCTIFHDFMKKTLDERRDK